MEYLDIRDEDGQITGCIKERKQVHQDGDLHGTSHVWIIRKSEQKIQLLLQKRSANKDAFPGCYDISSAGHVPAGEDFIESAIRELKEELGIEIKEEELQFLDAFKFEKKKMFYGQPFHNYEYSKVYILWKDIEPEEMVLQQEEVESVMWMDFKKCYELVEKKHPDFCIFMKELHMIEKWVKKNNFSE